MMKNKCLLLLLFINVCAYSQTMTEKYNSYLNRYECFDSSGNLTGYKTYNSYLGVWEYYSENANTNIRKPIEYAKPQTDDNFALLQQVANQKQNSYNSNHKRVEDCLVTIQMFIDAKDFELRTRVQNRFNSEVLNVINNKGYDYSNTSLTNQVIQWIKDKYMNILSSESKKNDAVIETKPIPPVGKSTLSHDLEKYIGSYKVYRIEEFKYYLTSSGKWTLISTDTSMADIKLYNNQILFKRSNEGEFRFRELYATDLNSEKYYIYDSNYGETYIEKDFETIIFYDKDDKNHKYIYYINK